MDAREAALLEPESTISEMRKSFPQATKLDEAETKLLTLFRIRRLPCTPGINARRVVVHNGALEEADKALSCFVLSIHNMEAEEAALLAPEATVSEMRKCFPHATRLDETETELLTLLKIRRQDVKGKKYNIPNKRSRT